MAQGFETLCGAPVGDGFEGDEVAAGKPDRQVLQAVEAALLGIGQLQADFDLVGALLKALQDDAVIGRAQLPADIGN